MPVIKNSPKTCWQAGFAHLFVLIAALGLIAFVAIANIFTFQKEQFSELYPKEESHAAGLLGLQHGAPIDDTGRVLITEEVANRLAGSGATIIRVNFRLGPYLTDTPEFYARYDEIVNRLRSKGLQVMGLMSNESWRGGQDQWIANSFEREGKDGYNSYIDGYGYAFGRMAKHFEGRIRYWEVWNEPNAWQNDPNLYNPSLPVEQRTFPNGSFIYPSNFAALLTHAHSQVKHYNKLDVEIISGGVFGHDIAGFTTGGAGADYLDDTYRIGINNTGKFAWAKSTYGTYPLDHVGQHIYITGNRGIDETAYSNYLDYVHNVLVKYEGSTTPKKTWVTEYGWATNMTDENTQANNLAAAIRIMDSKPYIGSHMWFKMDDEAAATLWYGLYREDLTKKPAFDKFRPVSSSLVGKKSDGTTVTKILDFYNNNGGQLTHGTPVDNGGSVYAHNWDYGYVQDFNGGSIGPSIIFDTGFRVAMSFRNKYLEGTNHHILKFPTSGEFGITGGTRQNFQGGFLTWSSTTNSVTLTQGYPTPTPTIRPTPSPTPSPTTIGTPKPSSLVGRKSDGTYVSKIKDFYVKNGGQPAYGLPVNNGGTVYAHYWDYGYVQDFNGGSIGPAIIFGTGFSVTRDFRTTYLTGSNHTILKFPTSKEFASGSGTRQNFQGGYMTWDPVNKVKVFKNP